MDRIGGTRHKRNEQVTNLKQGLCRMAQNLIEVSFGLRVGFAFFSNLLRLNAFKVLVKRADHQPHLV